MTATQNDNAAALTVEQIAERWGCARNTVMAAIKDGRLVAFKLGKRTHRVAIAEVERFEKAGAA